MNADGYEELIFSRQALSSQFVSEIICNPKTNILLKRQLSLYWVLFKSSFAFVFDKAHEFTPKYSEKYTIEEDERMELIKNWLTWVIRDKYGDNVVKYLPFKLRVMQALAKRKPILAVDHLITHNNWIGATSIASFEDSHFRKSLSKCKTDTQLLPQLKMLLTESINDLECH